MTHWQQLYNQLSQHFRVEADARPMAPRPLHTVEGIGDRLRTAAFAEVQAEAGFLWAVETFPEAPEAVKNAWLELAAEEHKHLGWLLTRATELGIDLKERPVSERLWKCLHTCVEAGEFFHVMALAESTGKRAGERFEKDLATVDARSAKIFGLIAQEETRHIELAHRFYPGARAYDRRGTVTL